MVLELGIGVQARGRHRRGQSMMADAVWATVVRVAVVWAGCGLTGCEPGAPPPDELGQVIQQAPELPSMEEPYVLPLPRPDGAREPGPGDQDQGQSAG